MSKRSALVLSGGGARGALQVGAVQALVEIGYHPEILVGTSIGAANGAILAMHGFNEHGVDMLTEIYREAAASDILSPDYLRLYLRALVKRPATEPSRRLREFYIHNGITPSLHFGDLNNTRLLVIATDINHYTRVVYGMDPDESVLDAVVASTAIPPWVPPIGQNGKLLMDGGLICNLPIEPALGVKPKEIIALDVQENREIPEDADGFGAIFNKLANTVQKRQCELEMALAAAARVPVRYIHLQAEQPVPIYDFQRWEELIDAGYRIATRTVQTWPPKKRSWWSIS